MSKLNRQKSYLTPKETAAFLNVSTETIRKWSNSGKLKAISTLGGHRRFRTEDIEKFASSIKPRRNVKASVKNDSSIRVLIVDDDSQYTRYLSEIVSTFNDSITIETANDGFEAGCKLVAFNPEIVLLDLVMPRINGIQVCRFIKSNPATKHIRIISITGYTSTLNNQNFLNAGVETILEKPVNVESLKEAMLGSQKSVSNMGL